MKNTPSREIIGFIDMVRQYGLIADFNGRILHFNSALFDKLQFNVSDIAEVFGNETKQVLAKIQSAISTNSVTVINLEMDFGNGTHQIFGHIYPLEIGTEYFAMMLFHPIDMQLHLERMLFERRSKRIEDSRWTLDTEFKTLTFFADEESIFYGREPGFSIFEAIADKDHKKVHAAFDKALASPGGMITIHADIQRKIGTCKVEADIIYLPNPIYGDRYFVLSRPAVTQPQHTLNRLSEAFQVPHDKDLATALGVTAAAISNIRTGSRKIPDTWLAKCCRQRGVNFQWLDSGIGEKFFERKS